MLTGEKTPNLTRPRTCATCQSRGKSQYRAKRVSRASSPVALMGAVRVLVLVKRTGGTTGGVSGPQASNITGVSVGWAIPSGSTQSANPASSAVIAASMLGGVAASCWAPLRWSVNPSVPNQLTGDDKILQIWLLWDCSMNQLANASIIIAAWVFKKTVWPGGTAILSPVLHTGTPKMTSARAKPRDIRAQYS